MKFLFTALFLLAAAPLSAQPASLRSGDHAEFTRLTLPLPEGSGFTLTATNGRADIGFTEPLPTIDPRQVFDRIGRTRLADVVVGEGPVLELSLACDCPINASLTANNLLIVDILDGPPLTPPTPPSQTSLPNAGAPSNDRAIENALQDRQLTLGLPPIDAMRPDLPATASELQVSAPQAPPGTASPAEEPRPAPAETPLAVSKVPPPSSTSQMTLPAVSLPGSTPRPLAERLVSRLPGISSLSAEEAQLTRELEQSLLAAIGSAATEGLLQPGTGASDLTEQQRQLSTVHSDGNHPDPGLAATPSTFGPETAEGAGRIILSGNPCALFMPPLVASDDMDFTRDLKARRSQLTGELDRDNVEAYHELAHFYLLHGFGPEAASVLASVQQPPREAAEMASIARILEYGHDPKENPFTGRMTCDTDAALWAALAPVRIPPGSDFDSDAIKRSLMAMPDGLKGLVGPLLAERFLDAGETDFTRDLLRIVERNLPEITGRQALAEAKLATQHGPPDAAAFRDLIAQNSDVSPEALLHFTNSALEHEQVVDAETIGLLESYRTQYRDSPLAAELTRAEILALGASGNFPSAFELYDLQREKLMPEVQAEIIDSLSRGLADRGSDAVFTRLYFTHSSEVAQVATVDTVDRVADRLIRLGLPEVADRLLADEDPSRSRRLLRARAALALNLPRRAEAELADLDGADVSALRAMAHLANADFAEAEALFTVAGKPKEAANAAWLARNWQSLREDEEETRARLAGVMTSQQSSPIELPQSGPPTLAASREALNQSGETRAALQALLSSLEVAAEE